MKFLSQQNQLNMQFKQYVTFLIKRERYKSKFASNYAKQIQDFTQSGLTTKKYFEAIRKIDEHSAESFLMNFKHFVQFQTEQYFDDFHHLRWEITGKHKRGQQ